MTKLLVVVDYQNDFISGSLGFEKATKIKDNILTLLKNHQDDIVFTFDTHDENYLKTQEGKNLPICHCIKDTLGWQMPNDFDIYLKNAKKIFYKNTFGSLELANFLKQNYYSSIEFCGLVSHICVFSNIILAQSATPNSKIILHKNATTSFSESLEKNAYEILQAYGIELL
ncbi:hydrolase [Campylobacter ornithocola]|uniref:nicotinamidase n=1 Tax=Campylobacter ornithocola TaxID=1848766 RepID=A0A6M8MZQ5_9BACT|nr:isochorismatase family cysteine hydrolase [Campylobacter ornithocola]OCX43311.1 hydrolase [Campylobacter ornithocola]QKF56774.1 pyrazinamidase / nicotinamidase [Campylobacter ornithocola]